MHDDKCPDFMQDVEDLISDADIIPMEEVEVEHPRPDVVAVEEQARIDEAAFFNRLYDAVLGSMATPEQPLVINPEVINRMYVWQEQVGHLVLGFGVYRHLVVEVCVSFDDTHLVTLDVRAQLEIHINTETGEPYSWTRVRQYEIHGLDWIRWHYAGNILLAGSENGDVYVWGLFSADLLLVPGDGIRCTWAELGAGGFTLFARYAHDIVELWNLHDLTLIMVINIDILHPLSQPLFSAPTVLEGESLLHVWETDDTENFLGSNCRAIANIESGDSGNSNDSENEQKAICSYSGEDFNVEAEDSKKEEFEIEGCPKCGCFITVIWDNFYGERNNAVNVASGICSHCGIIIDEGDEDTDGEEYEGKFWCSENNLIETPIWNFDNTDEDMDNVSSEQKNTYTDDIDNDEDVSEITDNVTADDAEETDKCEEGNNVLCTQYGSVDGEDSVEVADGDTVLNSIREADINENGKSSDQYVPLNTEENAWAASGTPAENVNESEDGKKVSCAKYESVNNGEEDYCVEAKSGETGFNSKRETASTENENGSVECVTLPPRNEDPVSTTLGKLSKSD